MAIHPLLFAVLSAGPVVLCMANPARAQDGCSPDDPEPQDLLLTPAAGTPESVTLDAPMIARFPGGTDLRGLQSEALLTLARVDDDGSRVPVPGNYERFEAQPNVLVFRPDGGLEEEARYEGTVHDPRGSETRQLSFTTGTRRDEIEPRFGSAPLRVGASNGGSTCGDTRIDVTFEPAEDDGPRGSIEYLVFQTRGASLQAPVLRQRVRATMPSEVTASFVLTAEQTAEPVCVQVWAVDGVGRVGEPLPSTCVTPAGQARFSGLCALAPARPGPVRGLLIFVGVAALLGWRRMRFT